MFDNIGQKLKTWAKWFYVIELVFSVVFGFVKMAMAPDYDSPEFTEGLFMILLAPFVGLLFAWLIYAFGHLVEQTEMNQENTRQIKEMMAKSVTGDFKAAASNVIKNDNIQDYCETEREIPNINVDENVAVNENTIQDSEKADEEEGSEKQKRIGMYIFVGILTIILLFFLVEYS